MTGAELGDGDAGMGHYSNSLLLGSTGSESAMNDGYGSAVGGTVQFGQNVCLTGSPMESSNQTRSKAALKHVGQVERTV